MCIRDSFRIVGEVLAVEPIAIMLRKDDAAFRKAVDDSLKAVSYTHLRAHETVLDLVCRLLLEKKKTTSSM